MSKFLTLLFITVAAGAICRLSDSLEIFDSYHLTRKKAAARDDDGRSARF